LDPPFLTNFINNALGFLLLTKIQLIAKNRSQKC
jgi:hypothetical protein